MLKELFAKRYGRGEEELAFCREFVNTWWKEEAAHRIRIGDEVIDHAFIFDLPWDMEQTQEYVKFDGDIDWLYQPGDDPEFIYQLNRHRYWVCMGQAYALTGEEKYAQCFASQLTDWLEKNPITEETKPKSWRTIEAGLRAESWVEAMGYFVESPAVTEEVFDTFIEGLICHGDYLAECDVPFSVKSNWGVLENTGLYAIGTCLSYLGGELAERGAHYTDVAKKRLAQEIRVQVMDDGVHWEQSPMYHNEVLSCYMAVLRNARLSEDSLPKILPEMVKKMAYANLIWQKPDGSQPCEGDSDETDLRDILTGCAYVFQDPVLKSGGYAQMDFEGIWNYGREAAKDYDRLPVIAPAERFHWLRDSGNWYLRSSWEKDADYFHFRCGSLGGGHGHFDKTHVDLVVNGEDILVDTGRYTYVDGEPRRRFKSAKAHNTVTVDGLEYTNCLDSWGVQGLRPAITGNAVRKGEFTLMEGGHFGYMEQGIYVERRVLALGTKVYLLMDTCRCQEGEHVLEQHFHMAPECETVINESGFTVKGRRSTVEFMPLCQDVEMTKEAFEVSRHYNLKEDGEMVTISYKGSGVVTLMTAIVCEDGISIRKVPAIAAMNRRVLADSEAEAVEILACDKKWIVVNAHVEQGGDVEYIGAEGVFGLGRVMVGEFTSEAEEPELTVLKW